MAFWDFLKRPVPVAFFTPNVNYLGAEELGAMVVGDMTPAQMWETQPHLRTVVSYLARNVAQLGLHCFVRDGEDRVRDRDSVLARLIRFPNGDQTSYDLIFALVGDISLYDRAYWLLGEDEAGAWVRRLPPTWVSPMWENAFTPRAYRVVAPSGEPVEVPARQVLAFAGYHPSSPRRGSPTIESLKGTLQEQIEASKYRRQVWKRGGRVSAVLQRPKDAPEWTDDQANRFREDWYANWTGNGPKAGGTPILEDGMTLQRVDFNAQEQQFVEAAKLSFTTVASAFHVNPTMVGILDNANYSNVREFRRMLYGDTLGPLLAQIEGRINTFLIPMLGLDPDRHYVEFNINEKLQGSFEEQAQVMSTLVGRPILTADEGRALFNRPALGGDAAALVTPLNVLIGGQASPADSGTQNLQPKSALVKSATAAIKAATPAQEEQVSRVLNRFFERQGKSVLSAIGAGEDWWKADRWDEELTDDLLQVSHTLASILGPIAAERLGFPDDYDPDRTVEFLRKVSSDRARGINATTKAELDKALESDGDPAVVFETAKNDRARTAALSVATFAAGFAVVEAGKQIRANRGGRPTKTWITGTNPRPSHAAVNGETVDIEATFSNGMEWPGQGGDPDDAGCNCGVQINYEPEEG